MAAHKVMSSNQDATASPDAVRQCAAIASASAARKPTHAEWNGGVRYLRAARGF